MNALICLFFISYGLYALFNNIRFWFIYIVLIAIYTYLTQIKYFKTPFNTLRRRMMIGTWGENTDPQIYAKIKLDIGKMEEYLLEKSNEIGEKITLTLFSIKLLSIVLKKYPEMYSYIKLGKIVDKDDLDICCLVAIGEGEDLASTTIRRADTKDFKEIYTELKSESNKLRNKKNEEHNRKKSYISKFPTFLLGPLIQISAYLASIGIAIDFLGVKKFEFGSCLVTSMGSLGVEECMVNIPPASFVPILVSISKRKTKYYYDNNKQVKEKKTLGLNITIDHRFIDPKTAESINSDIKLIGENPEIFESEMKKLSDSKTENNNQNKKIN